MSYRFTKDLGESFVVTCSRCSNEVAYHHLRRTVWVSFAFVPLFRLRTHLVVCPICTEAYEVTKPAVPLIEEATRQATALQAGQITGEQYKTFLAGFHRDIEAAGVRTGNSASPGNTTAPPFQPAVPSVAIPAAGWHPDPHGRFEHRWWDGARWTELVATAGQTTQDPIGA